MSTTPSIPEIVLPAESLDQATLIGHVRQLYEPLLALSAGDAAYQRDFVRPVRAGLRNCEALSIDRHPMHLRLPEMIRPRGMRIRRRRMRHDSSDISSVSIDTMPSVAARSAGAWIQLELARRERVQIRPRRPRRVIPGAPAMSVLQAVQIRLLRARPGLARLGQASLCGQGAAVGVELDGGVPTARYSSGSGSADGRGAGIRRGCVRPCVSCLAGCRAGMP